MQQINPQHGGMKMLLRNFNLEGAAAEPGSGGGHSQLIICNGPFAGITLPLAPK
jgi:hypothetical protein